jgi:hypothetical protein
MLPREKRGAVAKMSERVPGGVPREPTDDETPWIRDFHDPQYEARRLFCEALGTFLLVLVMIGAIMVNLKTGKVPLVAQVIAPGLLVTVRPWQDSLRIAFPIDEEFP